MTPELSAAVNLVAAVAAASVAAVWQGALLAAAVGVCLRLMPGLSARVRWSMWLMTFLAVACIPLVPMLRTGAASGAAPGAASGAQLSGTAMVLASQWAVALVGAWAGLSLYRAVRLARGLVGMLRIAGRAVPVDRVSAMPAFGGAAGAGLPAICCSAEVTVPCVAGLITPRILLPPKVVQTATDAELRQIVLHEAEHLRRGDVWVNLLQKAALAVFPWSPALLWVDRRLSAEREMACDDAVLRVTGARKAYATCLANLADTSRLRQSASLALGAWAQRPELARRVTRILAPATRQMGPVGTAVAMCGVTALLAGVGAGLSHAPQLVGFRSDVPSLTARNDVPMEKPASLNEEGRGVSALDSGRHGPLVKPASVTLTSLELPSQGPGASGASGASGARLPRARFRTAARARHRSPAARLRQISLGDCGPAGAPHLPRNSAYAIVSTPEPTAVRTFPVVWHGAGPDAPVLLTSPDLRFTYAAVPVRDGWIFLQL